MGMKFGWVDKEFYISGAVPLSDVEFIFDSIKFAKYDCEDTHAAEPENGFEYLILDETGSIVAEWTYEWGEWGDPRDYTKFAAYQSFLTMTKIWWVSTDGDALETLLFLKESNALAYAKDFFVDGDKMTSFDDFGDFEAVEGIWQINWGYEYLSNLK
jgi:hypothetical protein